MNRASSRVVFLMNNYGELNLWEKSEGVGRKLLVGAGGKLRYCPRQNRAQSNIKGKVGIVW